LFQNFVQIDNAIDRYYAGTGSGLALVKQIVEYHGSKVGLTSQLGIGSCFTIDLPATTATRPAPATDSSMLELPIVTLPVPAKILLVEADRANIETMTAYLGSRGYQLLLTKTGQKAIDLAQEHCPDLMLMNMPLTVMDELAVIRRLRQLLNVRRYRLSH
jgi:hypothetical protein